MTDRSKVFLIGTAGFSLRNVHQLVEQVLVISFDLNDTFAFLEFMRFNFIVHNNFSL